MKDKKVQFKTTEVILLLVITCIFSTLTGCLVGYRLISSDKEEYIELDSNLQNFIKQYNNIKENYYGKFNSNEALSNAMSAVLESLGDDYSGVLDSNSNKDNVTMNGEYEGVGLEIYNKDNSIFINNIYKDTPAEKAGILIGDKITKFNDQDLSGKTTTELVKEIKSTNGKLFKLEIERNNQKFTVELKIEKVILKSAEYKTYNVGENKVGYIKVDIFAANTHKQFSEALKKSEQEKVTGIIIDLRNNPGGLLTTATNISDLFLNSDKIIYQTQSKTEIKKYYSNGNKDYNKKIVILVNNNSASASELLSATLKENLNAILIGTKTFGKGTVQEVKKFGSTQYKYTTKLWLTPKGNNINKIGIVPDIVVEQNEQYNKEPIDNNDKQLQTALEQFK